jgi:transposase, IS30 family
MAKGYHHLTYSQRCQISILKEREESQSEIARMLGVHRSTICRELTRNRRSRTYEHDLAEKTAQDRRRTPPSKQNKFTKLFSLIEEKLNLQWSPVQISGRLKEKGLGAISPETIYKYIRIDKKKGGTLYKNLRHQGKKYNKKGKGTSGRGCIPGRIDIKERPAIVEEKKRVGDWELDTIIGANHNGVIVSMVDRATKYTRLMKVFYKTAEEVGKAIIQALSPISEFVHTLTADNGKEFAYHQMIGKELGATVYFATPYHSWERGLNEHTNGLVRQYFPKGMRFDEITEEEIKAVEAALNSRPRKILLFETPVEAFERLTAK